MRIPPRTEPRKLIDPPTEIRNSLSQYNLKSETIFLYLYERSMTISVLQVSSLA